MIVSPASADPPTIHSFINTLKSNIGWLPGNFSMRSSTIRVLQKAGLSTVILSHIFDTRGAWAKMGNQCFQHDGDDGILSKFGT
jgi:hypothetical protein